MITISKIVPEGEEEIEFLGALLFDREGTDKWAAIHIIRPSYWTLEYYKAQSGIKILDIGPISITWKI